jgi:hypothetical protein
MGLHWGVLQTVAWAGMLIHYSHGDSVGAAVEKTFDGRHPCPLCDAIAKSQQSSSKTPEFQPAQRIDMDCPSGVVLPAPAAIDFSWPMLASDSVARVSEPIVPPPRVA